MDTSYNIAYLSTGKLQATTVNIYADTSGSIAAAISAVTITASTATATGTITGNIGHFNLVDSSAVHVGTINGVSGTFNSVTSSVTVPTTGTFDIDGFNQYEGKYAPGDLISYKYKGTMPSALTNGFFLAYLGDGSGFAPNTLLNINFYEIVYWGADSRSSNTTRMSATVLIPSTIINNTIVSYKHGALLSTYQENTLWKAMKNVVDSASLGMSWSADLVGWMLATTGYVTVCADSPGYGVSNGFSNFGDTYGETQCQYNAIVALKQLIVKQPSLFTPAGGTFLPPIKVINTGYSLGGIYCPIISQLIRLNTTDFTLVNTIPGAPVNSYEFFNKALYDGSGAGSNPSASPTNATAYIFNLLYANSSPMSNASLNSIQIGLNPDIATGVLPIFNQLYLTTPGNVKTFPYGSEAFISKILYYTQAQSLGSVVDSSGNYYTFSDPSSVPYIVPNKVLSSPNNYLEILNQGAFYSNKFVDYSDLSGTPINIIYSFQDELCCYNPANPYVGSSGEDSVAIPYQAFVTSMAPGLNGLNRDSSGDYVRDILDPSGNEEVLGAISQNVTSLINTELYTPRRCYNTTWNTTKIGVSAPTNQPGITHINFQYTIFQAVLCHYLLARGLYGA